MSPTIQLYDATLRDGMGGGGLTLTAEEKVRVVHALDALGVHMIEAGFPASNPKEQELFGLLADERLDGRRDRRLRHDPPARRTPPSRTRGCACSPTASRRSARSWARPRCCTSRRSCASRREENLAMIAESSPSCVGAGKRVLLDAEHFFDGFALDPGYALDCLRAAAEAGAERVVLCDTNGGSLPPQIRTAFAVVARSAARRRRSASTPTTTPAAPSPTRSTAVECRRHPGAGHDQRHRRAHRQRQPRHDHRRPAAEDGRRAARRPSASRG